MSMLLYQRTPGIMPDCTMPDCTMPDYTMPDYIMPDCTMPDCIMPDCPDCFCKALYWLWSWGCCVSITSLLPRRPS